MADDFSYLAESLFNVRSLPSRKQVFTQCELPSTKKNWYWYFKSPLGCELFLEKCCECTSMLDTLVDNGEIQVVIGKWRILFKPFWIEPVAKQDLSNHGLRVIDGGCGGCKEQVA